MSESHSTSSRQTDAETSSKARLQGLDFNQLKKLYHRSRNVNAIALLLVLGVGILAFTSMNPPPEYESSIKPILIGLVVFYSVTVAGLYLRTPWGRVLGIIACVIALVNFPIGTLVGIFGLYALFGAPELFGKDRIAHKELEKQFHLLKATTKKG